MLFHERQTLAGSRPAVLSGWKHWHLHFGSNNHAAFDDHIRFGTEESGIPEHEICRMILTAIWHILSDLKSYTPEGFLESRPVKEEKILSTSQALNLLRQRGYVIKDEPLTVS